MKKYIVSIKEVDPKTGKKKEVLPKEAREIAGLTILAKVGNDDHGRGLSYAAFINDSPAELACRIASCPQVLPSAELAVELAKKDVRKSEDDLIASIMGESEGEVQ